MNDQRLKELHEQYKERLILDELLWTAWHEDTNRDKSLEHKEYLCWLCHQAAKDIINQGSLFVKQYKELQELRKFKEEHDKDERIDSTNASE